MAEKIRISDLGQPRLTELQQSAIDYGETLEVELTPQSILDEATEAVGLEDFGSPDFLFIVHLIILSRECLKLQWKGGDHRLVFLLDSFYKCSGCQNHTESDLCPITMIIRAL